MQVICHDTFILHYFIRHSLPDLIPGEKVPMIHFLIMNASDEDVKS